MNGSSSGSHGPPERSAPQHLDVDANAAEQRIDNFLIRKLKGVPRAHVYRILRRGEVRVNRGRVPPTYRLQPGDSIRVPPMEPPSSPRATPQPPEGLWERLRQAILWADDDFLVVDKPAGLAVHRGSGVSYGVIDVMRRFADGGDQLELAHRLDQGTSGCLVLARHRQGIRRFQTAAREGRLRKSYIVLVNGEWPRGATHVAQPLTRHRRASGERAVHVDAQGKSAETRFAIRARYHANLSGLAAQTRFTLLDAELASGRTHQIRVHTQSTGHPIAGDDKYGRREVNRGLAKNGLKRLFLHAARIDLPTRDGRVTVTTGLPPELAQFLDHLREAATRSS